MTARRLFLLSCFTFLTLACAAVMLFVSVITRGVNSTARAASDRRIVYGLTFMPSGFDPHINQSAELGIPLRSVYDTLVYRDPATKQFVPGLAEKVEISSDGLTYTFALKQGVKFHDGTPFNAEAVAANLDRITNPETRSQKALFLLGPYEKYTVVDEYIIQIALKQPYSPLLDALSQVYLGIASPKALQEYDRDRYQLHQVGTGPYLMVEYIPGDFMLLRRNPDYAWGPDFYVKSNPAPVEEIEFRFFTDPATRAPALESGAAHIMGEIPPTDALILSRNPDLMLLPQPIPGQPLQFFFNTKRPPTDLVEVRRAILEATNRIAVVDAVFQQFSPTAYGPLAAATEYYFPGVRDKYPFDAAKARQALAAQGYTPGPDKMLQNNVETLRLTLVVLNVGFAPQVAQRIQSLWREVGIEAEIRQVPNLAGLLELVKSGEYHLLAFNDFGVDAHVLNNFYRSDAPNNFSKFASPDLDDLLARAAQVTDPAERQNLYATAQVLIMDQALVLPIRDYVNLNAASRRIGNLTFDAYGWFPLLWNLTLDARASTPTP